MLQFNEETHEYTHNGRVVPSVTTILKGCGIIDDTFYTEEGASRGKRVHQAIEMYEAGLLRIEAVSQDIVSYMSAYLQFRSDMGARLKILSVEEPKVNLEFWYAGTPDLVTSIDEMYCIIDPKTGPPAVWHKLQLAAYGGLDEIYRPRKFYTLHLKATGKYSLVEVALNFGKEFNSFLACLSVYNWKLENIKQKGNVWTR
jgi:hypothetical protein